MPNRTNRTPTDGTSADRRKDRLADPEGSDHFDAVTNWTCPVKQYDLGYRYRCDYAAPHPEDGPHSWVLADTTGFLPAVPPQDDGQVADPPATPDVSGETPEPSHTPDVAAGSGGRAGRPSTVGTAVGMIRAAKEYDETAGKVAETFRPDARESVLAALGGVYNPAADPGYAIRLADDFARNMVIGPAFARMVQANADKQPPDPKDVRELYRKVRQIAATHGIDLDDNGGDQ